MLSRIAESLFWIGRYIERSDGTARILDVHLQLLLEDPVDRRGHRLPLAARASWAGPARASRRSVARTCWQRLAVDRDEPGEHRLRAHARPARTPAAPARSSRPSCGSRLNTTNARMPRRLQTDKVHEFFQWVRERSALAVGIVDSSTSRDEAWQFFTLGRSIERADMTARLLATRSLTEAPGPSWTTILRSCGAYEAYLRTYRGMPSARNAAEFLLLDRLFPRSIIYSISAPRTA